MTHVQQLAQQVDAWVCEALRQEVALEYKPGLVCPSRNGSHADMNCASFEASIHALEGYFGDCLLAGLEGAEFRTLQQRGVLAEQAMFKATQGVNTHKGAIFLMGLLAGALGAQYREQGWCNPAMLGVVVAEKWGANIVLSGVQHCATPTHGRLVKNAYGLPGAREQAADGFPVLFETTLPQLQRALSAGLNTEQASLHALLCTISQLPDTNLAHRGGMAGLQWAQSATGQLIATCGVGSPGFVQRAQQLCDEFEARWLSPGGSADLLSAALFIQTLVQACTELPHFRVFKA